MPSSYTSRPLGFFGKARRAFSLYAVQRDSTQQVAHELALVRHDCARLTKTFGANLVGQQILDVGPGQFLLQSRFFAVSNQVTALDPDIIPGLSPRSWLQVLRLNGFERAAKTFARKLLGIDRAYRSALKKQLGIASFRPIKIVRGDIASTDLPPEQFDCVYSRSVLHHVLDPAAAFRQMARLLKPGGVACVVFHLYTSSTGSLHPQVMTGNNPELLWGHLRPSTRGIVEDHAVLNRLRLAQWRRIFSEIWPGSIVETVENTNPLALQHLARLAAANELEGYTREELVTDAVIALWQKPHLAK